MARPWVQSVRIERDWNERLRDWVLQTLGFAAAVVFGTWTILAYNEAKQANAQSLQANSLAFAAYCAQLTPTDNVGLFLRRLSPTACVGCPDTPSPQPQAAQVCDGARKALENSLLGVAVSLFGTPVSYTPVVTTTTVTSTLFTTTSTGGSLTSRTTSSTRAPTSAPGAGPTSGPDSSAGAPGSGSGVLGTGQIVGIVIGVTFAISTILALVVFGLGRRRVPATPEGGSAYLGR